MEEFRIDSQHLDSSTGQATPDAFAQAFVGKAFVDDARKLNLNKLLHLAPYSEVLLLVGEEGVGKSVLLQQFVARAKQLWKVVHIPSSSLMTPIDVARQIVHGFGLPSAGVDDVADLLSDIGRYLQALGRSGRRAIIVVDDVHLLQAEVVRLLETILDDERSSNALGIVFSIDASQAENFQRFSILQDKLAYTLRFEALSEAGVAQYIRHRLEQAGRSEAMPLFADAVVQQIYDKSGGLPGAINDLAGKRLSNQMLAGRAGSGFRLGIWVPAVLGVVIVSVILVYQNDINQLMQSSVEEAPVAANAPQQAPMAAVNDMPAEPPASSKPVLVATANVAEKTPDVANMTMGELTNTLSEGVEVKAIEEVALPKAQPVVESVAQPAAQPKVLALVQAASKPVTEPAVEVQRPEPKPLVKKSEAKPAAVKKPKGWIELQDPNGFTMQLMALRDEAKVKAFVDRYSKELKGKSEIFYIKRKGKILTALVYGSYPSHAEVTAASKTLPKAWGKPWVRSFASVQKDMLTK